MHKDLLQKHKLVGMSREQLFELLGPPERPSDSNIAEWRLGPAGTHDDNYLNVHLKDNQVISYEISLDGIIKHY